MSLSAIPPDLEHQLEARLQKFLGPKVLEDGRQQCAQLLTAAKTAIDQKTSEGYENFLRRVSQEIQVSEQRARQISKEVSETATRHLQGGLEDFRQKLTDGGNSLKRLSDELLEYLQQNVNQEYTARRGELEQFRERVTSESARLHEHIEYLDVRIRNLSESTRSLESGLDHRLGQLSSNTVKETRTQLESVATEILEELTARVVKVLGDQLDEATEKMYVVQKGVVASTSESLKQESASALATFGQSMDKVGQGSVERWRQKLARGLNAVAKSLGEPFEAGE